MGQVYVLVSNWCLFNEGLCLRAGRAGEEGIAKGWTHPHWDARVVSHGGFRQEKGPGQTSCLHLFSWTPAQVMS